MTSLIVLDHRLVQSILQDLGFEYQTSLHLTHSYLSRSRSGSRSLVSLSLSVSLSFWM